MSTIAVAPKCVEAALVARPTEINLLTNVANAAGVGGETVYAPPDDDSASQPYE